MEYLTYKQALERDYFGAPWLREDDFLDAWFDDPDRDPYSLKVRCNDGKEDQHQVDPIQ